MQRLGQRHLLIPVGVWLRRRQEAAAAAHHEAAPRALPVIDLVTRGLLWATGRIADDGTVAEGALK